MRKNTSNQDYDAFKTKSLMDEAKKAKPDYETLVRGLLDSIPTEKVMNLVFKNKNGLTFEKYNDDWGITETSYSNGSAYADLDNDGDMDLIINNIDQEAHVYKNNADLLNKNHYLRIKPRLLVRLILKITM